MDRLSNPAAIGPRPPLDVVEACLNTSVTSHKVMNWSSPLLPHSVSAIEGVSLQLADPQRIPSTVQLHP